MGNAVTLLDISKRGPCSWSPALEGPALALFWPTSSPSNEEFGGQEKACLEPHPPFQTTHIYLRPPPPNSMLKWLQANPLSLSSLSRPQTVCTPLSPGHGQGAVVFGVGEWGGDVNGAACTSMSTRPLIVQDRAPDENRGGNRL